MFPINKNIIHFFGVTLFISASSACANDGPRASELAFLLLHSDMDYGEVTGNEYDGLNKDEKHKLNEYFAAALQDKDRTVRSHAVYLLAESAPDMFLKKINTIFNGSFDDVKFDALRELPKLSPIPADVEREVITLLENANTNLRRAAISALAESHCHSMASVVAVKRFVTNSEGLKPYAVCALGMMGDFDDSLPLLREAINGGDAGGIVCAGKLGDKAASLVPDLIARGNKSLSDEIVMALGNIGKSAAPALPLLVRLAKSPDSLQKGYAVEAIVKIGVVNDDVLDAVDSIVGWMPGNTHPSFANFGPEGAKKLFPKMITLKDVQGDDDWNINRTKYEWTIKHLKEMAPYLKKEMLSLFTAKHSVGCILFTAIAKCGPEVAKPIAGYLDSPNNLVRYYAVLALKDMGPQAADAIPELISFVNTTYQNDLNAWFYATETLGEIGERSFPYLREAMNSNKPAGWAIHAMGYTPPDRENMQMLLKVLSNTAPGLKSAALESIARLNVFPDIVVPALIGLIDDENKQISGKVIAALAEFKKDAKPALPKLKEKLRMEIKKGQRDNAAVLSLACTISAIAGGSIELNDLIVQSMPGMKFYDPSKKTELFERIDRVSGKSKNILMTYLESSGGKESVVIWRILLRSGLITESEIIKFTKDENGKLAQAANAMVCETGTAEARDACIKYAMSPRNPRRNSK